MAKPAQIMMTPATGDRGRAHSDANCSIKAMSAGLPPKLSAIEGANGTKAVKEATPEPVKMVTIAMTMDIRIPVPERPNPTFFAPSISVPI